MLISENLTKGFFKKKALSHVSCQLEKGKIYGILGPNGSGKTTFMKIAAGLIKPTSGTMTYDLESIGVNTKGKIVYMPTDLFIYGFMKIKTVGEYFNDFYADFDMDRYKELISFMDLDMEDKVKGLSTGMGSKLKIAAALSRKAELYMLDEPLNGIDIVAREKILHAIVETANESNTLLISSHLVDEMEKILDDVLFLKKGEIVLQGGAEDIRSEHGKSIVQLYKEVFA
jgi:ABC-2 type transport system ATP-binding protein